MILKSADIKGREICIEPIEYSSKEKVWKWFLVKFSYKEDYKLILDYQGHLELADFTKLMSQLNNLVNLEETEILYKAYEPHIIIKGKRKGEFFALDLMMGEGPYYSDYKYTKISLKVTKKSVIKFVKDLRIRLLEIDSELEPNFEKINVKLSG